ncbi:hypothetical protein HTSR_0722 [Halodesulfurarchaeum formicicum]|uniref:Uncharacterized protein n=2 Tax=Halodesulfurarchaeum formicicum TaxID=1873524 RepID=A0A1D8S3H5_9EURY|nr:hypothetical protein HTSR_0722 [Halodesulfurarchaeum formicicum]APE95205.1 hypothetical protein HSR6_0748 [Halodesulfurarchaeum formicicum]
MAVRNAVAQTGVMTLGYLVSFLCFRAAIVGYAHEALIAAPLAVAAGAIFIVLAAYAQTELLLGDRLSGSS